jgi:eukaryotic-like serine/threonine-protein kinase
MDFVFGLIFSNPYVPWLLLAVAAFIVYKTIISRVRVRGPSVDTDAVLGKVLGSSYTEARFQKQVKRLKQDGSYLAAGRLLEERQHFPQAVEVYLEGEEYHAAAVNLERLGNIERAAEFYLKGGDHKKAAQILSDAGKPAKAAALFLEKGNTLDAARLYSVAGAWDKSAELYLRGGYPLRAAEAFDKAGNPLKAAECYEKHFMENVAYSTTYSSTGSSGQERTARQAGQLYEKAGQLEKALQIYTKGQYFAEAAEASMKLGRFAPAAELFMRAEDPNRAADAYERAGDRVRAANLRGEVAWKEGRTPEAAAFFQQGQDYLRAAELFESAGKLAEAAAAYEAGDSFAAAGSVYVRAGLKSRAAASYAKAGENETAARLYDEAGERDKAIELYERAGFTFKSGEAAAHAGDNTRAIALLQRVSPTDEHYLEAVGILARLLIETGRPTLAVERLQKALARETMGGGNLELYYWLAAAHEIAGQTAPAVDLYKKILAEDLGFRDVEKRVVALEAGKGPTPIRRFATSVPKPAGPSAPSAPSAVSASSPSAPSAPSPKAARFVRKEEVGRGPLGIVYRAEDRTDGRSVALRALPAEVLKRDGVLLMLAADLRAAAQVSHPSVVKVLGLLEVEGERCVVGEYVAGRNFAEALRGGHKMSVKQVHSLGRVLAQVLAFLHGRGIVHGSIQPSNIMVASGVIKLADLGLGRLAHPLPRPDGYRAPEAELDAAGDLYAMAAVLYHLLTGVHPRTQAQGVGLPLPGTFAPGVPEALDKLLVRSLHPRRELRPVSAEAVLEELKDMVRIV